MATSKIPRIGTEMATSTSSFADMTSSTYLAAALDKVVNNIATYSTGVHQISGGTGPTFTVILGKYTDQYFSGLVFTYAGNEVYFFKYVNGARGLRAITM